MFFVGIALLIAAGLALVISTDAGTLIGLTKDQTAQLIPLVLVLIVIAGGMFSRRKRFGELLGGMALWAGMFAVAMVGYTLRDDIYNLAGRVFGELSPGIAVIDSSNGTATFRRGMGGHFPVNAMINGSEIHLIFDTGASAVVLSAADARAAGINTDALSYVVPVSTANGTGKAASVRLDSVEVGGIVRNNVRAFITEDGALETSLLGMTFLETLTGYAVAGNALQLHD